MKAEEVQERVLNHVAAAPGLAFGDLIAAIARECNAYVSEMAAAALVLIGRGKLAVDREGRLRVPEEPAES